MLEIKNITKTYLQHKQSIQAVQDISLRVEEGDFVSLVGPSGGGKTTLLKVFAGLLSPSAGQVLFRGENVSAPSRERGMVFQQFSLFPWLTVKENVAFGLKIGPSAEPDWEEKVESLLRNFGLYDFKDAYPKSLSGGMQQRVAIARTLIVDPKVILMDEPFGSLDAQTRAKMQEFLAGIYEKTKKTIVFVTHDIEEAVFLSNKVYVLTNRPAAIKNVYAIPFSRPRVHNLKHSEEFFKLTVKIAEELEQ